MRFENLKFSWVLGHANPSILELNRIDLGFQDINPVIQYCQAPSCMSYMEANAEVPWEHYHLTLGRLLLVWKSLAGIWTRIAGLWVQHSNLWHMETCPQLCKKLGTFNFKIHRSHFEGNERPIIPLCCFWSHVKRSDPISFFCNQAEEFILKICSDINEISKME